MRARRYPVGTPSARALRAFAGASALVCLLGGPALFAAEKPRIDGLTATLEEGRAIVSYELTGALSDETRERILSGIPVRYVHRVEVVTKRGMPLLPARVLARATVETRVAYDSLTQRYQLERTTEYRSRPKKLAPPPEHEQHVTDSDHEAVAWMTRIEQLAVYDPGRPLDDVDDLRVKVEVSLGRRYVLLIFPATLEASAEVALEVAR